MGRKQVKSHCKRNKISIFFKDAVLVSIDIIIKNRIDLPVI